MEQTDVFSPRQDAMAVSWLPENVHDSHRVDTFIVPDLHEEWGACFSSSDADSSCTPDDTVAPDATVTPARFGNAILRECRRFGTPSI